MGYQKSNTRQRPYKDWPEGTLNGCRRRGRNYYSRHRERLKIAVMASRAKLKKKVYDLLGRSCRLCGYSDIRALTLDHVNNDGAIERKLRGYNCGDPDLRAALKQPQRYQILCRNCNWIKHLEFYYKKEE